MDRSWRLAGPALVLAGCLGAAQVAAQSLILTAPAEIEGDQVLVAVEPDAIRAIDAPRFLEGEAAARQMAEDEPVLGVRLAGEARAYPLGFLSAHEIVNDGYGDVSVAVTW